jgi:CIC family chloride channel protein
MFIVEELLKDVSRHTISTALLACFFAGIVSRYLGNHTLDVSGFRDFPRANFFLHNMPVFLILGLMSGVVGSALNWAIINACQWNDKIFGERYILRVALAGLLCGLVIALLPENFRDFAGIRQLIFEERSWRFAAAALAANFVLTSLAYGSGAPGGLFAPSLTIGAALGYLVGLLDLALFPHLAHSPTSLALAGMGAVFTAVARVPITATVIVFEMTSDFNLLLPLMICSIIAYIVGEKLSPGSIYDRLLELKGVFLNQRDENDPLANIIVKDFMHMGADTVDAAMKLPDMLQKFETSSHSGFPVVEAGKFSGIITQSDVTSKRDLLSEEATVKDVMTPSAVCASKDDTIKNVITILDQHGMSCLPIVEADGTVIGMIARSDVISALARHDKNKE